MTQQDLFLSQSIRVKSCLSLWNKSARISRHVEIDTYLLSSRQGCQRGTWESLLWRRPIQDGHSSGHLCQVIDWHITWQVWHVCSLHWFSMSFCLFLIIGKFKMQIKSSITTASVLNTESSLRVITKLHKPGQSWISQLHGLSELYSSSYDSYYKPWIHILWFVTAIDCISV